MSKIKIFNLCPGSWNSNCYILVEGGHAVCIDPSASTAVITEKIAAEGAVLDAILLTHGHFDHIMSLDLLRKKTGAKARIHEFDNEMLPDAHKNAFYDFFNMERSFAPAEIMIHGGDEIALGDSIIKVIHTPGHTRGSVCYFVEDMLITGDTIFANGYGRCDLYGGDKGQMLRSLNSLREYDGGLTIYPGHGASAKLADALDKTYL